MGQCTKNPKVVISTLVQYTADQKHMHKIMNHIKPVLRLNQEIN